MGDMISTAVEARSTDGTENKLPTDELLMNYWGTTDELSKSPNIADQSDKFFNENYVLLRDLCE